jgi:hypothetical protein
VLYYTGSRRVKLRAKLIVEEHGSASGVIASRRTLRLQTGARMTPVFVCHPDAGGEISLIFKTLIPLFMRVHRGVITAFLAIDIAVRGCLAAYSFGAGVKLWSVRRGAVAFAKRFLILYLIGNAAIFGFWVLLVGPSKPASYDKVATDLLLGPSFATLLWYSYLATSVRVRENLPRRLGLAVLINPTAAAAFQRTSSKEGIGRQYRT